MLLLTKPKYCNLGKQPEVFMASGKFSQSYNLSDLRFRKLEMLLESFTFFKLILNSSRLLRYPIDKSNSNLSILCISLPHQLRRNHLRDFNWRFLGKILRFWQYLRSQDSSSWRSPTDWWTSTKFMHSWRFNVFMFGEIIDKLGTFVIFLQYEKSIYFNVLNRHLCKRKEIFLKFISKKKTKFKMIG